MDCSAKQRKAHTFQAACVLGKTIFRPLPWVAVTLCCFTLPAAAVEQIVKKDGMGIVHTGSGDINITGYTIEEHERLLKQREGELRAELERLHRRDTKILALEKQNLQLEKQRLERELSDVEAKLRNTSQSYRQRIAFLENTIKELHTVAGEEDNPQLQVAIAALQQGKTEQADRLFQQIEERERSSIERAAKAAFERGKIAEERIDYRNAYHHYERAVGLSPENPEYLTYAGNMACILAKHHKAVEWEEKALASDLKTYGEDHPQVATYRNNLGSAWKDLGQYEKAIGYYEQALNVLENALGPDHPTAKTVAGNLADARAKMQSKAIQ